MNTLEKLSISGLFLLALGIGAYAGGLRTDSDFKNLYSWSLRTSRGREVLPAILCVDRQTDAAIANQLDKLIMTGADRAEGIFITDDNALGKSPAGNEILFEERLVLRMHQDRKNGRFIVESKKDHVGGLSAAAWFFHENFFRAYAGFHGDFRRCHSPLARGVAALASLHAGYRGNLNLLPDFKQEAAIALLLLNTDPELIGALGASGPTDPALLKRVANALRKSGFSESSWRAEVLLGNPDSGEPITPFVLPAFIGADNSIRDQVWKSALAAIPHPGLLAELGAAIWLRRTVDQKTAGDLDAVFAVRMLNVLERNFTTRRIKPEETTTKAIFDISQLTSIFSFIWAYRPEFEAWRADVYDSAEESNHNKRNTKRIALINRLAAMLTHETDTTVQPAAQLCRLFARHPVNADLRQPEIGLDYVERSVTEIEKTRSDDIWYIQTARLTLTWQTQRPLQTSIDLEQVVFTGASEERVEDEGTKAAFADILPVTADPYGKVKSPDIREEEPGKRDKKGLADKDDTPIAPERIEPRGFATNTPVLWRAGMDTEAVEQPVVEAVRKGFGASLLRDSAATVTAPEGVGLTKVWAEFASAGIETVGNAVRFELDTGATLVVGAAQELAMMPPAPEAPVIFKQAGQIMEGERLLGENGLPVRVVKRSEINKPTPLVVPTMAVYGNLVAAGILCRAGVVQHAGGILAGMQVDTPEGPVPAERLRKNSLVSAWRGEESGSVPTRLNSVRNLPVDAFVELRYDSGGVERVLRIAGTQQVLVYEPEKQSKTYACANPELLRMPWNQELRQMLEGRSEDPAPGTGGRSIERADIESSRGAHSTEAMDFGPGGPGVLRLKPGMLLVTETAGTNEPPVYVPLKSITAGGTQSGEAEEYEILPEAARYETFVPEIFNLRLMRVEGILLRCPVRFENTRGFAADTMVIQPPQGMAPGQPMNLTENKDLPASGIQRIRGSFLTTRFPEKLWISDRIRDRGRTTTLRPVRIETERGTLICGNKQILVAAHNGRAADEKGRRIEVFAEELIHSPDEYHLFFVNKDNPRTDGELEIAQVLSAAYVYEADAITLTDIVGSGMAGAIELEETSPDGEPVKTIIRQDIYFADGFMALTENESSRRIGDSLTGGGWGRGRIAPDGMMTELRETRVAFALPGLGAGRQRTLEHRIIFTNEERARFAEGLQRIHKAYEAAEWGSTLNRARFRRFLELYFTSANEALDSAYTMPARKKSPPEWTDQSFREYIESRAFLIEYGNPADLYDWAFKYIFLVTLAYETGNTDWGDALMQDFLCITMTLAMGSNIEQKDRDRYYDDPRLRIAEAIHWTRDVVSIVRDGTDGRRAWIRPVGWEDILADKLHSLAPEDGIAALYRKSGRHVEVELGALWMQLYKNRHSGTDTAMPAEIEPELAEIIPKIEGAGEARTAFLIISPSQDTADAFKNLEFDVGPYRGQNIGETLGIRAVNPDI